MSQLRSHGRLIVLFAAGLTASLPTLSQPTPEETSAEFEGICRTIRASDDSFFGQQIIGDLEQKLSEPIEDPQLRVSIRARLGAELVRLGRTEEGVVRLEEALALAEQLGLFEASRQQLTRDLAIAHIRAAETANCVAHHTRSSCILPLSPEAVHPLPAHSRRAAELYEVFLAKRPDNLQVRWLLNLARMTSGDYPLGVPEPWRIDPATWTSGADFPKWYDIAPDLGVNVVDLAGGAIMDDFDGDGLLDLVTSTNDPCGPMAAFRNNGQGGFENVTRRWGLDAQWGGLNAIHADYDNDGRLDLLVLRGGWWGDTGRVRNSLLRNDLADSGRFVDMTLAAGIGDLSAPTQTAMFADFDGDGDLDLYIGNESKRSEKIPSQLFRNRGDGTFEDITERAGVANYRYAKGVAWGDYDNDGDSDLYVSNIGPNRLYRNDSDRHGRIRFVDVAPDLGVTEPEQASFATWFFDYDNDGNLDLFVVDYGSTKSRVAASYQGYGSPTGHPVLYRNEGASFRDVSSEVGLSHPVLPMGANFGDLDNDGNLDIYLGTGLPDYEALMPNVMLRNAGGRFEDVTFAGGFGHLQKGHGIAFGDLDQDGDQDLFHQLGGQLAGDSYGNALFENPGNELAWVTLHLVGKSANRFGLGARIEVKVESSAGPRSVHVLAGSGGSFGGSSFQQEIGLGDIDAIESITIRWPGSGTKQTHRRVEARRFYLAEEDRDRLETLTRPSFRLRGSSR